MVKYWIFLLFLPIFISCASLSPVSSEKVTSFSDIKHIVPQWQSFADGVGFFYGKIASPKIEFWALKIDLSEQNLHIAVRGGAADSQQTLNTKVTSFVRDNNLLAGINAVPFDIISSREGLPVQNMGIVISDGIIIAPVNPRYDALVFYTDGTASIVSQSLIGSTENIKNAIGGFHKILDDGQLTQRTQNTEARHPRSAAGISPNGRFLYLLVIDGRRLGSIGATERETALLLRALGSEDGINFDGGGSSALALRYPDGRVRAVNTPIHSGIPGRERAVAGCLGVISGQ